MSFTRVRQIADAVLLEGYVLYPYHATTTKNRYRWTFGVLAPRAWSEAGGCEPWWLRAEVPVEGERPRIRGRLRCLRVVARTVFARERERDANARDAFRPVERFDYAGRSFLSWEEGELVEIDFAVTSGDAPRSIPFDLAATREQESIVDASGAAVARISKTRAALSGRLDVSLRPIAPSIARLSVRVENLTPFDEPRAPRAEAVRAGFVSSHIVFAAEAGARFLSIIDPPPHALAAASSCANVGTHPVLAGGHGQADLVLAAPIILGDHPAIAPESTGDFFDASEIDELLALRTRTLTPDEAVAARATDPRAARLVDRALALTPAELARLHGVSVDEVGTRRALAPRAGARRRGARPGARVRLWPDAAKRRTDAQDLLYAGRAATVEAIRHDIEGNEYLAVTLDDDPVVEMHRAKGRFHYNYLDEVELLDGEDA